MPQTIPIWTEEELQKAIDQKLLRINAFRSQDFHVAEKILPNGLLAVLEYSNPEVFSHGDDHFPIPKSRFEVELDEKRIPRLRHALLDFFVTIDPNNLKPMELEFEAKMKDYDGNEVTWNCMISADEEGADQFGTVDEQGKMIYTYLPSDPALLSTLTLVLPDS